MLMHFHFEYYRFCAFIFANTINKQSNDACIMPYFVMHTNFAEQHTQLYITQLCDICPLLKLEHGNCEQLYCLSQTSLKSQQRSSISLNSSMSHRNFVIRNIWNLKKSLTATCFGTFKARATEESFPIERDVRMEQGPFRKFIAKDL